MTIRDDFEVNAIYELADLFLKKDKNITERSIIEDQIEAHINWMTKEDIQLAKRIFLEKIGWEPWMGDYDF